MYSKAISTVRGSIFPIIKTHLVNGKFANMRTVAGTGFFIDTKGHFVTANHVIGDDSQSEYGYLHNIPNVAFKGLMPEPIQMIGRDPSIDLFVGKVTERLLPPIQILLTNPPVGTSIVIGGYPFPKIGQDDGRFQFNTVRQFWQPTMIMDYLNMGLLTQYPYDGFLVSHRTIPGMSGGPAINLHGQVVGMCTASMSRNSGKDIPHFNGICISADVLSRGISNILNP